MSVHAEKALWRNTPKLTVMGGGRGAGAGMKGEQFCKTHTFLKLGTSNLFFCVTRILFKIYSYMYRYMIDVFWEVFSGAGMKDKQTNGSERIEDKSARAEQR